MAGREEERLFPPRRKGVLTMRKLSGGQAKVLYAYVLLIGLFHIYTALAGNYEAYLQRTIHLTFVLPMAFIFYPMNRRCNMKEVPWYDWLLAFTSTLPGLYGIWNYTLIAERIQQVDPLTMTQVVLGFTLLLLLLEGTRRVVGFPLACIAALFALYMLYGSHMPGLLRGLSFNFDEVIEQVYLTDEGIFNSPLGISATYVMIFLIFGSFLEKSGAGNYFMEVAQALTGAQPGGPAQIAVISSCLFGSISGSAVANVYGTGCFTIPLMKKIGYPPYFAGAVEAVASSGGQLMPPIMGAGAFLMASFLGLPYSAIIVAAIFPALLYYGAVLLMVRLGALKMGLKGLNPEELPAKRDVAKRIYLITPVVGLVLFLLTGYTPMLAAMIGIALAWFVSFFQFAGLGERERRRSVNAFIATVVLAGVAFFFGDVINELLIKLVSPLAGPFSLRDAQVRNIAHKLFLFICVAWVMFASRFNPGMRPRDVLDAIHDGAKNITLVCVACASAGVVLGAVALTGIGGKLVGFVVSFSQGIPLIALLLVMFVSLILGMGLPTTGAYILAAALAAPILVSLGFEPLSAHMFVFYFAIISNITPPVALAAYAASSLAGSEPNKTGFQAMKLGFLAFIVPFGFCYDPGLLMQGDLAANLWAVISGIGAVFAFAFMWMGYIKTPIQLWLRLALAFAGLACLTPYPPLILAGVVITAAAYIYSKYMLTKPSNGSVATDNA